MSNSFYIKTETVTNKILELEFERYDTPDPQDRLILDAKISVLKEILKPQVILK